MKAIVYTSRTGTTEWYARKLSEKTGLPCFSLKDAKTTLAKGEEIVYLGAVHMGAVMSYKEASESFSVKLAIGVGLEKTGGKIEEVRKATAIVSSVPLFTLQGGYRPSSLKGFEKLIMKMVSKMTIKDLEAKETKSDCDNALLSALKNGGDLMDEDYLKEIVEVIKEGDKK
ncbi:MAG: flavodoxin domain-containing protein [Candidatus Ornithospirochaeta sp.]